MRFIMFNIYHFDDNSADLLLLGKALCHLWNVLNKVFDPINYGIMGKMRIYVAVDLVSGGPWKEELDRGLLHIKKQITSKL